MLIKNAIENEADRNLLASLMASIFGEDADTMTMQLVLPGDILKPMIAIYQAGYNRALNAASNEISTHEPIETDTKKD